MSPHRMGSHTAVCRRNKEHEAFCAAAISSLGASEHAAEESRKPLDDSGGGSVAYAQRSLAER